MSWLSQVAHVTLINLRTIPYRIGTSLVVVIGIAGVVAVLVSGLAMGEGFAHTRPPPARPARAFRLRAAWDGEMTSGVARARAPLRPNRPGIARHPTGGPLLSAGRVGRGALPRHGQTDPTNVPFRGVQPAAF